MDDVTIQPTDLPLSVIEDKESEWMPYAIVDVHGNVRSRHVTKDDAELAVNEANAGLSKEPARGTGAEPAKRKRVKQKEKPMPRGIPKKKSKKSKKRAVKSVVKKSSKKTKKAVAAPKKRRKKKRVVF